jgi:hypothetical protein
MNGGANPAGDGSRHWLHAQYRDFDGVPRTMICTTARGTYYFVSHYDPASGRHSDHYEIYRIPPIAEGEACASWFGLETRALERLPDLPVREFPFDAQARRFLPYDSIAHLLR